MADLKETLDHEGRISRLEGIIEEIRSRLSRIEADQRAMDERLTAKIDRVQVMAASLWAGVVIIIGLLAKIAFFN